MWFSLTVVLSSPCLCYARIEVTFIVGFFVSLYFVIKKTEFAVVVVVLLLFYVQSKHLKSCQDGQLT